MLKFPPIVTREAGMLQKITDVSDWIVSLKLQEWKDNDGFSSPISQDWADAFSAAIWRKNRNGATNFSPLPGGYNLSPGKNGPYCACIASLVIRIAATFANDLSLEEQGYYKKVGNASSQFPKTMQFVKCVKRPQLGTLNVRSGGHINVSSKNTSKGLLCINGNGGCKDNVADSNRDAAGGGVCYGNAKSQTSFWLLRINRKYPLMITNQYCDNSNYPEGGYEETDSSGSLTEDELGAKDTPENPNEYVATSSPQDNINGQIDEENSKQEAEVLALLSQISQGILTNEQVTNSNEKSNKEVKETKKSTDYEAKQISNDNLPLDNINVTLTKLN